MRVPPSFRCPIGGGVMVDPVTLLGDGESYSRAAIESWLSLQGTSPTSGAELQDSAVVPNHNLRNAIEDWLEEREARGGSVAAAEGGDGGGEEGSVEGASGRWAAADAAAPPSGSPPPRRELGEGAEELVDDERSSGSEEEEEEEEEEEPDGTRGSERAALTSRPEASVSRAPPAGAGAPKKVLVKNPYSKAAQANKASRAKKKLENMVRSFIYPPGTYQRW